MRAAKLAERQKELATSLPNTLTELKSDIVNQIQNLSSNSHGLFHTNDLLFNQRRRAKKEALEQILECFHENLNEREFDINQFHAILPTIYISNSVFAGLFFSQTKKLIEELEHLSHEAVILSLTNNRTIKWQNTYQEDPASQAYTYNI